MKSGIIRVLGYYFVGFLMAWVFYYLSDPTIVYTHAPGLHHLMMLFVPVGGLLWLIGALVFYVVDKKTDRLKWTIITHLAVFVALWLYLQSTGKLD